MNLPCFDDVIVIQDHDQIVIELGDIVDQADGHGFGVTQLGRADDLARFASHLLVDGLNGGDEVCLKPDMIVVALVKGKPRGGLTALDQPACYQGGFSRSRRSRDQG